MPSVSYPVQSPDTGTPAFDRRPPVQTADPAPRYEYIGGVWGYWGQDRRFYRAPDGDARRLEAGREADRAPRAPAPILPTRALAPTPPTAAPAPRLPNPRPPAIVASHGDYRGEHRH